MKHNLKVIGWTFLFLIITSQIWNWAIPDFISALIVNLVWGLAVGTFVGNNLMKLEDEHGF